MTCARRLIEAANTRNVWTFPFSRKSAIDRRLVPYRSVCLSTRSHTLLGVFLPLRLQRCLELPQLAGRALDFLALIHYAVVAARTTGLLFAKRINGRQNTQWDPDEKEGDCK